MTKEELIAKLEVITGDKERDHLVADALLLEFINEPKVTKAFEAAEKWYS